jgi:hypothetical protein
MTRIVKKNGTVLEGVPTFGWSKLPTFAGALEAALSITEHPVLYEDILGVSGLAFRTRWFVGENGPTGCPCSPTGESPTVWDAIKKTGWQLEQFMENGWDTPLMQGVIPNIVASIDAGRPVLVVDKNLDSAVVYGYADKEVLVRTYYGPVVRCTVFGLGQSPSLAIFLTEYEEPPPFPEIFKDSLKEAVTSWHQEKADIFPSAYLTSGKTALKAWISFLANFEELTTKEESRKLLGHHIWNYQHLYEARKAAGTFLLKNARVLPGHKALLRASTYYEKEVQLLATVFNSGDAFSEKMNILRRAFFNGEWGTIPIDAWTPHVRQRMKHIMEQALTLEESAIDLIESVVSA